MVRPEREGIDVAPVALAWRTCPQQRPDLDLFAADREHPSLLGTYLATSVVYAPVSGNDPRPIGYVPGGSAWFLASTPTKTRLF